VLAPLSKKYVPLPKVDPLAVPVKVKGKQIPEFVAPARLTTTPIFSVTFPPRPTAIFRLLPEMAKLPLLALAAPVQFPVVPRANVAPEQEPEEHVAASPATVVGGLIGVLNAVVVGTTPEIVIGGAAPDVKILACLM